VAAWKPFWRRLCGRKISAGNLEDSFEGVFERNHEAEGPDYSVSIDPNWHTLVALATEGEDGTAFPTMLNRRWHAGSCERIWGATGTLTKIKTEYIEKAPAAERRFQPVLVFQLSRLSRPESRFCVV